ncbi:MAG: hypothetical protein CMO01_21855 [Thalassobius sp.]|nr:hypothetical protein [Thalassovita sp.]
MKKLLWIPLIIILLVFYFLNIYNFLSDSHPVKADVLVVEGWLPPESLDKAIEEFNSSNYKLIATTGVPLSPEFRMPFSGYLIFNFQKALLIANQGKFSIDVNAMGTPVDGKFAEMKFYVNDSLAFETETTEDLKTYSFEFATDTIYNVAIWFPNDGKTNEEDRDLIVNDIAINGNKYLPRSENVIYDRGKRGGDDIYSANFATVADEAALILQKKGIPSDKIVAIPTDEMDINRTSNSALAFGNWLSSYAGKASLSGINVISLGTHSRRSWVLFEKNIEENIPVGIISLKSPFTPDENWWKSPNEAKRVLIESVKYVYTKVFL